MPTYCYVCDECEGTRTSPVIDNEGIVCTRCQITMRRDWRAEGANVNIANLKAAH